MGWDREVERGMGYINISLWRVLILIGGRGNVNIDSL